MLQERVELRALQSGRRRVDEQRPRERLVGPVLNGLDRWGDAAAAVVDLQRLELILVLVEERVAEVAHAAGCAGNAGDRGVVVLADVVVVVPDRVLLAVDRLGEVTEGPRVRAGTVEVERLVMRRLETLDLAPAVDVRLRLPDRLELLDGHAGDRVLGVGYHSERVVRHLELGVLDAALLAGRDLLVAYRLGGIVRV